jgi:hypothetical protein
MRIKKAPAKKTCKQLAMQAIRAMPESHSLADIAEELEILERIRKGEEAADAGRSMPLDQFKRHIEQWLSTSRSQNRRKLSTKG